MKQKIAEVYDLVEGAIDDAFLRTKLNLNLYDYLRENKYTRDDIKEMLDSACFSSVVDMSEDLAAYIEGGSDDVHKQLREAYGYMSKPIARKVKIYLDGIIEDVVRYRNDKGKRFKKKSK